MRTSAKRDGTDWVLNGTKMWITNGNLADVATVWAQTDDGIRGYVVPTDTPGFSAAMRMASITGLQVAAGQRASRTSITTSTLPSASSAFLCATTMWPASGWWAG